MANPFRDVAAGALDLAGTPIDILGLGAGAITGTASFLTGNGFWNGFVDNPFSQASQAYHDKVTDITGANEDSITRRLVGAADMLLAPTAIPAIGKKIGLNAAKKAAQKAGNLGRAAAAEKMLNNTSVMKELKNGLKPKTLAGNLGKYAVADSAFRMLMPGEGNATDSVLNKVALLYLGKKGFDKLRGSKAIDRLRGKYMNGDKTRADLAQMDPIEADRYKIQDFIDRIHDLERRVDIVDAKGASADIAHNL
ncbi:MAG: hypothetical protein HUJ56_00730, partial [Erysipelotrichaceae bacterium]|nr:hypothetical protein [Erysipelotrichaceae bacterium]